MGKPIIKGTRISVEFVIDLLGRGWATAQILEESTTTCGPEDVQACLAYASEALKSETGLPVADVEARGCALMIRTTNAEG